MTALHLLIKVCRFCSEMSGFKLLVIGFRNTFFSSCGIHLVKQSLTQVIN